MKLVVLLGLLGLSLAGFRGDMKKAGSWIKKHHAAIEQGLGDAIKVGSIIADDSMINVQGLIQDGIQTVGDATQKNKNVTALIDDGLRILGDLLANNTDSTNTEELFSLGGLLHDAGDVASIVGAGAEVAGALSFVNVQGLIQDGIETVGDATQKNKNITALIDDGLRIIGDLLANNTDSTNTEELFSLGGLLHDAGDVAGIVGAGLKVAEVVGEASFVNVQGLIQNGIQTVGDATQKNKNVTALIDDGLRIIGDLAENNGNSNTEELFSLGGLLHDAGDVASIVGAGAEVAGALSFVNVQGLIQDGIQTVGDATQKNKNVTALIDDGLRIVGDLLQNNGNSNTEELFSFGGLLHDAGDVAGVVDAGLKVAEVVGDDSLVNVQGLIQDGIQTVGDATQKNKNVTALIDDGLRIVGDLLQNNGNSNTEELFSFGGLLNDASKVAGVVGAGAEVAGLFA